MDIPIIKSPIYYIYLLYKCDHSYCVTIYNKKPSKSHILLYSLTLTLTVNPNSVFFSFEKSIMKIFLFSFESYFTTYFDIKSQI